MKFNAEIRKAIWLLILINSMKLCYSKDMRVHNTDNDDKLASLITMRLMNKFDNSNLQTIHSIKLKNSNNHSSVNYHHHYEKPSPEKILGKNKINSIRYKRTIPAKQNANMMPEELQKNASSPSSFRLISTSTETPLTISTSTSNSSILPSSQFLLSYSQYPEAVLPENRRGSSGSNIDHGHEEYGVNPVTVSNVNTKDINDNNSNFSNDNDNVTICYHEDDKFHMDCVISENETCFGNPGYCNYTYDQYIKVINDYIFPTTSEWILIISHIIVFIMGLVGNALVCVAVYTNYSMRTVTNVFIVNLAVADFFVILVCLPPSVLWDVTETWFMGAVMCKVVGYIQVVSVTVSVLTLTFISIDRWYAICFPLRYRTKISRAIGSITFIWIFAILSNIPELLTLTITTPKLRFGIELFTQCVTTWSKTTEENVMIARFMFLYTLPLLLMTLTYFKIVRVLWKSDTIPGHRESRSHYQYACGYSRGTNMPTNTSTMGQLRARRKAAKMLVAVVVMFAICYFPVHIYSIMRFQAGVQDEVKAVLALFSHWLCYANSAVNPVIYNFMSGKFRREFRNALEKCRCSRVRVEDRNLAHSTPASRLNNVSPSVRSNYQLANTRNRDSSRQTVQTTFMENCGNGHSLNNSQRNHNKTQLNNHHHIKSTENNKIP